MFFIIFFQTNYYVNKRIIYKQKINWNINKVVYKTYCACNFALKKVLMPFFKKKLYKLYLSLVNKTRIYIFIVYSDLTKLIKIL